MKSLKVLFAALLLAGCCLAVTSCSNDKSAADQIREAGDKAAAGIENAADAAANAVEGK